MPEDTGTKLNKVRAMKPETFMYIAGWIFIAIAAIVMAIIRVANIDVLNLPIRCVFNEYMHIYCPGCGGTRAIVLLLHGDIAAAFVYHPFVVYGALIFSVFMISRTLHFITEGKVKGIRFHLWFIYAGGAIVVAQWLIKLMFLLAFDIRLI